ncbi:MAG: VacB/RNase II family 3'-5' exoribonuclease [Candidatus Korobacteraceae bacterium]
MLSDKAILERIGRQPNRSAGYKQLIRELGLRGDERRELADRLGALLKTGKLIEVDRDRYTLPQHATARHDLIAGRLSMHRDGYGFVVPNAGQRTAIEGDVFIPPPAIGPAMHGDQVLVELTRRRDDGRAEGHILRVVSRGNPTIVGIFHHGSRNNFVTPLDEKVTQEVIIPAGMERPAGDRSEEPRPSTSGHPEPSKRVAGKKTLERDRVYDSGVRRRQSADMEGLVVDVEVTEWPGPTQNPRGRVVEILGYEDDFGVDVEIVIRKHHLPHRFPVEVLQEAQQFEAVIPAHEMRHRHDYRSLPIVTIDGETARDFDDAVTVRRTSNGNFELQVHIADVAHYVREGSAIDLEARLRGTSVYFPDRAIPMLPIELSTDLCSLRPQVERLVLSCAMEIDHQGEIVGFKLNEGVIRSAERMTYTNVNLILEGDPALRQHYHGLVDVFELMRELAMVLNRKRIRRGSIDFDLPEPVIEFDENGLMKSVTRSERNIAHRLIEEFMLAANECVATYLENKAVASLYRIHEKPDPKRVHDFETIAAKFGYSLGVGPLPVKRVQMKADRRERYSTGRQARVIEIPEEVHITPRMYQKLTQKIAGKPEERILSYLMLRSLKQARYSEINEGHFALAAPSYTHFTSPIRRYPDLIVHRILKEVLRDSAESEQPGVPVGTGALAHSETPSPWSKREALHPSAKKQGTAERPPRRALQGPIPEAELHDIAEETSQSERRAADAERELMEWKKAKFMEQHIGDEFEGLIVSVTKFGMFVELEELFVEGLVPLGSMTDDHYLYHENTRQLIGQRNRRMYSMGDQLRVIVDRVDHAQRRVIFAIAEEERPATKKKGRKKKA